MARDLRGYICHACARQECKAPEAEGDCTMHLGNCEWCGRDTAVTHVRNYGGVKEDDNA